MKKILALILAFGISSAVHAATPTPESVEKLLNVMQAEKTINAMRPQIDNMMKSAMEQATQGKQPSPEEQKILDKFRDKAAAIVKNELTIEKWKPMYVDIYSKNFTQEEVDGLIDFYESPTGKAYVAKMPMVLQSIMADMPRRMNPMMQEIQKASDEMRQEFAELKKKQDK